MLEDLENKEKEYCRDYVVEKGGGPFSWGGIGWVEENWVLRLLWVLGNLLRA
jgi:hypothetical protein